METVRSIPFVLPFAFIRASHPPDLTLRGPCAILRIVIRDLDVKVSEADMCFRRPTTHCRNRLAGIIALILSLVHGPLPQPDYHNIRHQDGSGEVCDHHDHLLRWHPGAGFASDVAVLHWHWFLPNGETEVLGIDSDRPAIHAHAPDWDGMVGDRLVISADTSIRFDPRLSIDLLALSSLDSLPVDFQFGDRLIRESWNASRAISARGVSVQALLQRWAC